MWKFAFIFIFTFIIWSPTNSLRTGAPELVCDTMLPNHNSIPPMSSPSPFRIEPTSNVVGQGQTVRVAIVPVSRELTFGGFMIQARNTNPPYEVIGQFAELPDGTVKLMNCGGPHSSATHTNVDPKLDFGLEWQAPIDFMGQIVFNATIAQEFHRFWVGMESSPVEIVKRNALPPPVIGISTTRTPITTTVPAYIAETEPTPRFSDPFYEGCGSIKTCFGLPDGCLGSRSCRAISAVTVRGDKYEFEMKANYGQPAYVALGLSTDDKMGDDSVMECVPQGDKIQLYSSWTSPRPNLGVSRQGVAQNVARLLTGSHVNGTIYCKVEREAVTMIQGQMFDLINNKYHLLLASGSSVRDDGAGYHDLGRLPSASSINLAVVQDLYGSSTLLLRLHGALMIIAWIGTTSLGILLARYFKQTWVGSQLCGKDQWFAWHRICMVITWSLTMAGFIIIFVQIDGWSAEQNPHAILGVVTTILCFLQPVGALLRPAPNSKNRPYFNWGHWFGGNAAHILAIVTIFFAVKLTKAELPEWFDWILVAFVAFHVIMHLIFSIAGCGADRRAAQRVNSFPMSDMSPGRGSIKMDRKQDAPFAGIRKTFLGIYIIILAVFVIALVAIVVLAPIEETVETFKSKIMDNKNK